MSPSEIIIIYTIALVFLLAIGLPVAFAMGLLGLLGALFFMPKGSEYLLAWISWSSLNSFTLTAVPLYIFLGTIMDESGLADQMYSSLSPLLDRVPGGLLHTNVLFGTVFAAISGSSVASTATIGTIALDEMERRGYDRRISFGSISAGGTLGILIPPSVIMIVYGDMVGASVGKLFMAGVIPGLVLSASYLLVIVLLVWLRPNLAPKVDQVMPLKQASFKVVGIWPALLIMLIVLGGIYGGVMTATEAAAISVTVALVMCLALRKLDWKRFQTALMSAVKTGVYIQFIVCCAKIMTIALANLRIPTIITEAMLSLPLSSAGILIVIILLYLVLGCFLEGLSMILLTLPVIYPVIIALHYDPVWFGILIVFLVEAAMVTPPVGMNLFILKGLRPQRPMSEVVLGCMPFFAAQVVVFALVVVFPSIALWLPSQMIKTA